MPRQPRKRTRYTGVYIVENTNYGKTDTAFYIRYKREGKATEERAGRASQGMTAARANQLRISRLAGKNCQTDSGVRRRSVRRCWRP